MSLSRRTLLASVLALPLAACSNKAGLVDVPAKRRMVITIDDFNLNRKIGQTAAAHDAAIRAALAGRDIKAIAFPSMRWNETSDVEGALTAWAAEGHIIGNHTYSHERAKVMGAADFLEDIKKNEALLTDLPTFKQLLRFPYLDEGGTPETRDAIRAGLEQIGYRNVPVTIDAVDWAISNRFERHLSANTLPDSARYRDFYVEHTVAMAAYYDAVAKALGYGSMTHTLLIHHNVLNAEFLPAVLDGLVSAGWRFEPAEAALTDEVLASEPDRVNPGWSHLNLLQLDAKAAGDYELLPYPERAMGLAGAAMDAAGL